MNSGLSSLVLTISIIACQALQSSQKVGWSGKAPPLHRLLDILKAAASNAEDEYSQRLICATYTVIWLLSVVAPGFWEEVMKSDAFGSATQDLLLDHRPALRHRIAKIITEACSKEQ